jgi:hypothetical protein
LGDTVDPLAYEALYASGFAAGVRLAFEKMRSCLTEMAERAASTGHYPWSALAHNGLAGVDLIEGQHAACLEHVETALGYADDNDATVWLAHGTAASALDMLGRTDEALEHLRLAREKVVGSIWEPMVDISEAIVRARRGETDSAAPLLVRAAPIDLARRGNAASLTIGVSVLASAAGDHQRAGRLLASLQAARLAPWVWHAPYIIETVRAVRGAVGSDLAHQLRAAPDPRSLDEILQDEAERLVDGHQPLN